MTTNVGLTLLIMGDLQPLTLQAAKLGAHDQLLKGNVAHSMCTGALL